MICLKDFSMKNIFRKCRAGRLILLLPVILTFCVAERALAIIDPTLQMQLGNLSGATADPNNHQHYLIQRSVESIDYSDVNGCPNWASWDLTSSDVGSSGRGDNYTSDSSLPAGFRFISTGTYGT